MGAMGETVEQVAMVAKAAAGLAVRSFWRRLQLIGADQSMLAEDPDHSEKRRAA
jgi:hypothetical protein